MSEKYQQIKDIFSDSVESEPLTKINIKDYRRKVDYIEDVYNHITKDKYADMKKDAIEFLEIPHSKLDKFLIEIICSNLYCDLALILQIVGNKTKKKEYFFRELTRSDTHSKNTIAKLEGRLNPERLNTEEELKTISNKEHKYYAPTVIKAYKETLFVKRAGTSIFDISTVFIDLFKALFYEPKESTKDIRKIKSYRLWEFTPDTIYEVANIYQQVLSSENSYKHAELVLLERLFGLLTLNEILSKGFNKKDIPFVTNGMGKINTLGYGSMTQLIASKINYKNHHIYEDIIAQYIRPICSECINAVLQDIIPYLATRKIDERSTMVEDLLRACHINLMQISGKNLLKNIDSDHIMKSFKTLFDLPENIDKEKKKKALIVYLSSQSNSYSYDEEVDEEIDDEILTTSIVNDRSYESLYIPQYIIYPDFDEDDKPKFSRRIKY